MIRATPPRITQGELRALPTNETLHCQDAP
jgi:hypothetical protein